MKALAIWLLLCSTAFAAPTSGALTLYVAPAGSDGNACTGGGSEACATIQGALNKAPHELRDQVTISVAAGSYAGFYVSGFVSDQGYQQTTGGLLIDGAMGNSSISTGTATGTATSATQGSHVRGTLTDSGQSWTTDDLQGRYLVTTGGTGSGQTFVISSNTVTAITILGAWAPTPDATTTYAIQEPTAVLNSSISSPASTTQGAISNSTTVYISGSNVNYSSTPTSVVLRKFRFTATSSNGVTVRAGVGLTLDQLQFAAGSATGNRILATTGGSDVKVNLMSSLTTSTTLTHAVFGSCIAGCSVTNSLLQKGKFGLSFRGTGTAQTSNVFAWLETIDTQLVPLDYRGPMSAGGADAFLDCASASGNYGVGLGVGTSATAFWYLIGSGVSLDHVLISDCERGVLVHNGNTADLNVVSSSNLTTAFDVRWGGTLVFDSAGTSATGSSQDISMDNGAVTSTKAAVGTCLTSANYLSRVCKR